jgi:hypothetical protein
MILDKENLFSDSQAITAAAASTNHIDLGSARDIGTGEDLYVFVNVEVAFTDSGSDSTLAVALEGDSTESFTPDGTVTLFTIPALAAIGNIYFAKLSPGSAPLQYRYIRLKYTPSSDLTTGTITAGLVKDIQKFVAYPAGVTSI